MMAARVLGDAALNCAVVVALAVTLSAGRCDKASQCHSSPRAVKIVPRQVVFAKEAVLA
jgi:hypothetical protein